MTSITTRRGAAVKNVENFSRIHPEKKDNNAAEF